MKYFFLRSYLFGDVALVQPEVAAAAADPEVDPDQAAPNPVNPNPVNPVIVDADLGAAHQALLQREAPTGFQPYNRPNIFPLRVSCIFIVRIKLL